MPGFIKKNYKGILLCLAISVPAWLIVKIFSVLEVIGAPVIAIVAGMIITLIIKDKSSFKDGIAFTSFVLGLYNASGPGQAVDSESEDDIHAIAEPVNMKILVSLSCTMCPELVTAAQKIASMNEKVTANVYDINHFPALKEKYNVMSVPCLVINDTHVTFGKKNIRQLLDIIHHGQK